MANLIEKYPVSLILKKILKDSLSGELEVKGEHFTKRLFFLEGELEYATSDLEEDRLGEVLFTQKKITHEQLVMLRRMKDTSPDKFGKLLVQHKILTIKGVYAALQNQMKRIAISTFHLTSGQWTFTIGTPAISESQSFTVSLPQVIIEGYKEITDFSYFKRRFSFRSPMVLPMPEEVGQMIESEEIKFYVRLTKCQGVSTEQVMTVLNISDRDFWRRIAMLYLLGVIDFTEFRVDEEFNKHIELINDLHDKLSTQTVDHYELLDLKDTASVSEVRDRYFSFTKTFDPEMLRTPPDSLTREKTDFIVRHAAVAFDTLGDEEKKKAYDTSQIQKAEVEKQLEGIKDEEKADDSEKPDSVPKKNEIANKQENEREKVNRARQFYLKAHSLYEQKRFIEAVRLLEEAIRLDSKRSNYYMLLGLSQTHVPSLRPYAEKNLQTVADLEPWNADPIFYLGQLYWSENLVHKAETHFRKALEINMEHTLAAKMIKKIESAGHRKGKDIFSKFLKKS